MKRFSERWMSLGLVAALLLVPTQGSGYLAALGGPLLDGVAWLAADAQETAIPADPRTVALRRLAYRTREMMRFLGDPTPEIEALLPNLGVACEAARRHDVPVSLVLAIIHHESRFDQEALSPMGAVGLMQVMPAVARSLAESEGLPRPRWLELFDSRLNVELGVILLKRLHEQRGSWEEALAAYNAGSRAFVEEGIREDVRRYIRRVNHAASVLESIPVPPAPTT